MKVHGLLFILLLALIGATPSGAVLTGRITDASGGAVAGARVFAEPGIESAVVEGRVDPDGTFTVEGEYFGNIGVFAVAPGFGFGGVHLNIADASGLSGTTITLTRAAAVSGRVTNEKGRPVANARLASMAIVHPVKVGIPFFKLSGFGILPPTTNDDGRFMLEGVPDGAKVALKFEHASYAQEAVPEVAAGTSDLEVKLYHGVTLRGRVTVRGADTPVSGAIVTVRNAQPPHDTAFSGTDGSGTFRTMLKPGVYMVQAHAAGRISPGMQRVELRGELPEQQVFLSLSDKGAIAGSIQDAKSGEPIAGARVLLETAGQAAGAVRTGRDGRFRLDAPEGINTLHFDSVDGYLPPDTRALQVTVPARGVLELPGLWLAPVSDYTLRVVESDGETPVPGAFVSLLWPRQFGWQRGDDAGRLVIRFRTLPSDNRIIGLAEHPEKDMAALFALDRAHAAEAEVVLLPQASVSGRIVNEKGEPMSGITVGAMYADDTSSEALPLWRCVTGADGSYSWPAVPAGVPQRCVASTGRAGGEDVRDFNPAPGEHVDLGEMVLPGKPAATADPVVWKDMALLCGPQAATGGNMGLAAFYCGATDAPVYLEAAASMREQLRRLQVETVVVVNGYYDCDQDRVPVYRGAAKGQVTRVFDRQGRLMLEAVGLPPVSALRQSAAEPR